MEPGEYEERRVEQIRRNDPTVTRLSVLGNYYDRYGDALQGNTVVEQIDPVLPYHPPAREASFDSLLRWIQSSPSLRKVGVLYGGTQLVRRFLLAIANNGGIQEVRLNQTRGGVDAHALASLLRSARPKLKLNLVHCGFHFADGDRSVRLVQDSLRGNTSIERLSINYSALQVYTTILPVLSSSHTITEVALDPPRDDDRALAIQAMADFLQSPPTSLEHLKLGYFEGTDEGFETILEPLTQAENISKLTFNFCEFDPTATNLFSTLFQANPGIHALTVSGKSRFSGNGQKSAAIFGDFVQNNTTLNELDIGGLFDDDDDDDDSLGEDDESSDGENHFSEAIRGLEVNSTVECLKCGFLDEGRCSALVRSLPKFTGLKELSFSVVALSRSNKLELMQAFKQNSSLTKIEIEGRGANDVFTAADLSKIEFYMNRNKHAPSLLLSSTEEVSVSLRPKLYTAVRGSVAGPSLILRDLKRFGDKIGPPSSRKRNEPSRN